MNDVPSDMQVLIVDDEVDICYLLNGLLKQNHIHSEFVTSLRDAKATLKEEVPALVLLDNRLQDGVGMDFIPYIREHYPATQVVMISAHDGHQEKKEALESGARAFISKPFTREDIISIVRDII